MPAAGARWFIINYRVSGRGRRYTIGSYPVRNLTTAREEAVRLLREIDLGHDPMGERHSRREAPSLKDLAERLEKDYLPRKRPSTQRMYDGLLTKDTIPRLGRLNVCEGTHSDVERLHPEIRKRAPYHANRAAAVLSRMMSMAIKWRLRSDNPVEGVERNDEEKRTRYLSSEELVRLSEAVAAHPNQQSANALWWLLLTGARRSKVLSMRWADVNLQAGVWVKPSAHTKTKR